MKISFIIGELVIYFVVERDHFEIYKINCKKCKKKCTQLSMNEFQFLEKVLNSIQKLKCKGVIEKGNFDNKLDLKRNGFLSGIELSENILKNRSKFKSLDEFYKYLLSL